MPSKRSGASYNPSRSSQKGYRHDYGRSQSVTEGQGSVNESQIDRLCHSDTNNPFPLQTQLKIPQQAFVKIYKSSQKAYNNALQHKEYQILADLWKNCMNSSLTVRKFLGNQKTCKLLNGWNPLMEKKKMILLTAEWRKNNPPPPKQVPKNSPNSQKKQFQCKKAVTSSGKGLRKSTSYKALQPGIHNPKDSAGCHGKCVSDGQNYCGISEKGGSKINISERISDIMDGIPNMYIAINDIKSHISNKNSSICNNLKTNNLILRKINETLMFFEKGLRRIRTSNNKNSFGNKINEQSAIIKELTDKYLKFNIADIIETRIKQPINIIQADNKKIIDYISDLFTEVNTYTIDLKKCFDTSQEQVLKLTMKLNQVICDNTRQTELWKELTHKEEILEPSRGQAPLKEVPKLKEWSHFSGEGEYDHMEYIRGIDMIEKDFELPEILVTARFNTLFTKSAHRWYIKLRQAHGPQSWTWWKTQIINKWSNDAWRF
ncbi:hypothetical protein O181_084152 [Austropuccinia psidii MF-1]|uniref:Uncharacterized protein n=1 Tax=Austropuccinia psidii MF-1 TaxID=1389203 RepID=A0A9Q3IKQ9_9BASI|nr:hypothetical protein [Austropuccinia psidii MF-1]